MKDRAIGSAPECTVIHQYIKHSVCLYRFLHNRGTLKCLGPVVPRAGGGGNEAGHIMRLRTAQLKQERDATSFQGTQMKGFHPHPLPASKLIFSMLANVLLIHLNVKLFK